MNYEFYIPFPPSVNNYYVKTQRGVFISSKGKKFREQVAEAILQQVPGVHIEDPVLVEIVLFPPDNRRRDIDNYLKSMMDAITQTGFWTDDCLVDQLFVYRGEVSSKNGHVVILVTDAGPKIKVGMKPT